LDDDEIDGAVELALDAERALQPEIIAVLDLGGIRGRRLVVWIPAPDHALQDAEHGEAEAGAENAELHAGAEPDLGAEAEHDDRIEVAVGGLRDLVGRRAAEIAEIDAGAAQHRNAWRNDGADRERAAEIGIPRKADVDREIAVGVDRDREARQ